MKDNQVAIHGLLACHKVYLQELSKTVTSHTQAQLNHHNFVYVSTLERATQSRSQLPSRTVLALPDLSNSPPLPSRSQSRCRILVPPLGANHDAGFSSRLAGSQSRRRILVPLCNDATAPFFDFSAPRTYIFLRAFSSPRTHTHIIIVHIL